MFKFIDLFAGIGGFRIAFEEAGGQCVFSSEIDSHAKEVYEKNFKDEPYGDITKIPSSNIPDHDVLCAGFPCQPFSIGGYRKGFEDTRGTLFFEIARIIRDKQPSAIILENVSGITSHDHGKTIDTIMNTLDELGYHAEFKIMNAKDYGVPQNRNRWYCVGFKKGLGVLFNQSPKKPDNSSQLIFEFPNTKELEFTLNEIISDKEIKEYEVSQKAQENIEKFLEEFKGSDKYNDDYPIIANNIRPSRCHLSSTGISPCLTAKMGTGGNNIPVVVKHKRKLTEKECLKLMGFPEWFDIKPNNQQSYKQIGNSVVVPVISSLATRIAEVLQKTKLLV
ncbi:DNA cytosine methyltransferase [Alkalibacillus aidingensis]|uniref:DNA cytosine methyltransferase n=1 Tax=Alkalibacillus aidingensis TaxID=2747607 RepID=UPI001660B19E|nr:DNA cytosine methyltransferase [Alkalibacillus aidingensis]